MLCSTTLIVVRVGRSFTFTYVPTTTHGHGGRSRHRVPPPLASIPSPNNVVSSFLLPISGATISFLQNEGLLAPFSLKYVLHQPWNESHFMIHFHGKSGSKFWILARMATRRSGS
jgi:hypothetical protein